MNFYLIDYENTQERGLLVQKFDSNDALYVFYTSNAEKVSFDTLAKALKRKATLVPIRVPVGNQSADEHIKSYLGFLIGRHYQDANCYYIVSNDKGYDLILPFWQKISNCTVERIGTASVEEKPNPDQVKLNKIQQALTAMNLAETDQNYILKLVRKKNGNKMAIYQSLIQHFGQKKGLEYYHKIKNYL